MWNGLQKIIDAACVRAPKIATTRHVLLATPVQNSHSHSNLPLVFNFGESGQQCCVGAVADFQRAKL